MSFPQEWYYSDIRANAGSGSATVVLPACVNISHVITHISAGLINIGGSGTQYSPQVQVIDGSAGVIWAWDLSTSLPAAGQSQLDSHDEEVLIIGTKGASLTITFSAATVLDIVEMLTVRGYDT